MKQLPRMSIHRFAPAESFQVVVLYARRGCHAFAANQNPTVSEKALEGRESMALILRMRRAIAQHRIPRTASGLDLIVLIEVDVVKSTGGARKHSLGAEGA